MKYIVTINNKNYEVEVEKGQANIVKTTETAKQIIPAAPSAAAANPAPSTAPAPAVAANGVKITAPMPGTVLSIKVKTGDKVKKGDLILTLEAMKMENEIMAPNDGVVQIIAAKGSSVSTGDILAVIQ